MRREEGGRETDLLNFLLKGNSILRRWRRIE
jgi:hypothetical protein